MGQHDELRQRAAWEAEQLWKIGQIFGADAPAEVDFDARPKVQMLSASDIAPERIQWLWPGRIPLGMLSLFSGDPKLGKSLAALSLIAAVSRGGPLPGSGADGPALAARGSAILLSGEDDRARTIVPRLLAAGADMGRVKIIRSMLEPGFRGFDGGPTARVPARERRPTLAAQDLAAIELGAAELGDCRLIVFDPITAFLAGRNADVRGMLAPLQDMAERLGATVLLINYHSKHGASGTNGKYRVLGQIGYVGVCRANFMFLADPDDPTGVRRLMLDNGCNLGPPQPGLAYIIRDEGAAEFVEWLPETIDLDADAGLRRGVNAGKSGGSGRLARPRAVEEWLRGYLADGPKLATECERAALAAGFNRRLVERARQALAVRSLRSGFGKGSCCSLCLPEAESEPPDRPDGAVAPHTPHFSASHFRGDYGDYGEYDSPIGPTPDAGQTPGIGAAPVGDEVTLTTGSVSGGLSSLTPSDPIRPDPRQAGEPDLPPIRPASGWTA